MRGTSRIPLFGLPNLADVIRKSLADDGAGGISEGGPELAVYTDLPCRISALRAEDTELAGHGFDVGRHWKLICEYSPAIQELDFVRTAHPRHPNSAAPIGGPDEAASVYTLTHPSGSATLTWSFALGGWANPDESIKLVWDTDAWVFTDTPNARVWSPTSVEQYHNVTLHPAAPWNALETYTLANANERQDFRVVWCRNQQDDLGGWHHTSLVIELQGAT